MLGARLEQLFCEICCAKRVYLEAKLFFRKLQILISRATRASKWMQNDTKNTKKLKKLVFFSDFEQF